MASNPSPRDCSAHKALFPASETVWEPPWPPPLLPHSSAWHRDGHTVGIQEALLTHVLTAASSFWARKRLAIPHFPRTGCKVVAGVNNPLHRNQGPGEPGEAPNALLALNLDQKQQGREKVTVSSSSPPGGTDEIQISNVPGRRLSQRWWNQHR